MRIAVCPGSFDPVTLGHLDIIRRSSKLFDKVIVVVMVNYHKKDSSFTAEERVQLLHRCTGAFAPAILRILKLIHIMACLPIICAKRALLQL